MTLTVSLRPSRSARTTEGMQTARTIAAPNVNIFAISALALLSFALWFGGRQIQVRHAERAFELGQLFQVDWPDDVDHGEFLWLNADDCETGNLIADRHEIDFHVIAVLLAGDADDSVPASAAKLRHD